jgi:Tol biopolymer transport system component
MWQVIAVISLSASSPPLQVGNLRRLTNQVGCEANPSFSPDGSRVVYDGLVEAGFGIFAIDLSTKKREQLSLQNATYWESWEYWDYRPILSPDGKRIAYLHDSNDETELRVMPAAGDGHGSPLVIGVVSDTAPSWLTPTTLLAMSEQNEVLRFDLEDKREGKPRRTVLGRVERKEYVVRFVVVSPELVLARAGDPRVSRRNLRFRVIRPDRPSGDLLPLDTAPAAVPPGMFGRSIYYMAGGDLTEARLENRRLGQEASPSVVLNLPRVWLGFSISPDRKHVVYSDCYEYDGIMHVDPNGRATTLVSPSPSIQYKQPRFGGVGRALYSHVTAEGSDIYTLTTQTQRMERLIAGGGDPRLSPDAKLIAYVCVGASGPEGLCLKRADGSGDVRRLSSNGDDQSPQFSADGQSLVFSRGQMLRGGAPLFAIDLKSGVERPLGLGPVGAFALSPKSDQLIYYAFVEHALRQTRLGAADSKLLGVKASKYNYQDLVFSADAARLFFVRASREVGEIALSSRELQVYANRADQGLTTVDLDPDGNGLIVGTQAWDGDLYLADGTLP